VDVLNYFPACYVFQKVFFFLFQTIRLPDFCFYLTQESILVFVIVTSFLEENIWFVILKLISLLLIFSMLLYRPYWNFGKYNAFWSLGLHRNFERISNKSYDNIHLKKVYLERLYEFLPMLIKTSFVNKSKKVLLAILSNSGNLPKGLCVVIFA